MMDDIKLINKTKLKNEILNACCNMISSEEIDAIIENCEVDNPSDGNQSMSKSYVMKSHGTNYFPY